MTPQKSSRAKPCPPAVSITVLALLMLLAYLAVAIGSIAPIDFVYDGI